MPFGYHKYRPIESYHISQLSVDFFDILSPPIILSKMTSYVSSGVLNSSYHSRDHAQFCFSRVSFIFLDSNVCNKQFIYDRVKSVN